MKHPFWQLAERANKTDTDRAALAAIARLSTSIFSHLTLEQIYDDLLGEYNRTLSSLECPVKPIAVIAGSYSQYCGYLRQSDLTERQAVFIDPIYPALDREFSGVLKFGTWREIPNVDELAAFLYSRVRP